MNLAKVIFEDGDHFTTDINGTDEQVKEYYSIGNTFNVGFGEGDNLKKVKSVIVYGNVRSLQCGCCGGEARGRQWWNQDKGYGMCSNCIKWIREKGKETEEEIRQCYGIEHIHFNVLEGK